MLQYSFTFICSDATFPSMATADARSRVPGMPEVLAISRAAVGMNPIIHRRNPDRNRQWHRRRTPLQCSGNFHEYIRPDRSIGQIILSISTPAKADSPSTAISPGNPCVIATVCSAAPKSFSAWTLSRRVNDRPGFWSNRLLPQWLLYGNNARCHGPCDFPIIPTLSRSKRSGAISVPPSCKSRAIR